ncbi:TPR-like protein, partial [Ceratobasidium sp. AG-I]
CPPPSRAFTGREDILGQMSDYFFSKSSMDRRLFVLCGLGGAGKTQLALKFVQTHRNEYVDQPILSLGLNLILLRRFWDVFYIDATTRETILAGLITLAKSANAGTTSEEALAWLVSQEERWLLLLNNADDPNLNLREFFPACAHGDILITTRNQQMRAHTQDTKSYCSVAGMRPGDALALMLKTSETRGDEREIEIANELIQELGFFALAIAQSGAYMRATHCGLAEYHGLFQTAREQLLREIGTKQTDEYHMSVIASWEISLCQLSPRATQLLHMMSFMHHEGISETFFKTAYIRGVSYKPRIPLSESQASVKNIIFDFLSLLGTPSAEWNPLAFKKLTNELRAFSLLDYDPHSTSYSIHPLVQGWCRTTVPDAISTRECSSWVLSLCISGEYDLGSYAFRRRLLPHLHALDLDHTQMVPDIARSLGLVYREAGHTAEREALAAVALQASRDALGNKDPTTLDCIYHMAAAFRRQAKLGQAIALLAEGIEIEKQVLGHEHPDTLCSMHALAVTYRDQGRWQESEVLLLKVIEASKRVIGTTHSHTLHSMGMLALTYGKQDRLSEEEALLTEVVETMHREIGRGHPDTLTYMHNLAMTYERRGKLQEAELLMGETATLRKDILGESHIKTLSSVFELEGIRRRMQMELLPSALVQPRHS